MNDRLSLWALATVLVLCGSRQVGFAQRRAPVPAAPAVGVAEVPGGRAAKKADPVEQYQMAECILVGVLQEAKAGPVARSMPPIYTYRLTIEVAEVLRGDVEAGKTIPATYSARQVKEPVLPVGRKCIIVAETARDGGLHAVSIVEATDEGLKLARTASGLPLGWGLADGKAASPWAAMGEKAWPKDSGIVAAPGQAVCVTTGRPALLCGKGIKLTVEAVPPAKAIQWTNPDGDGLYTVTVENTTGKAVQVPALLADEKGVILWDESLVIVCQDKARPAPAAKGVSGKVRPATLEPGQRVSCTVNALAMDNVEWPRGGYRVAFRFCLGELSATKSFYYMSRHHDAIRDASRQGPPPK